MDAFFIFVSALCFGRKLDFVLLAGSKFIADLVVFWLALAQRFAFIEVHLLCCVRLLIVVCCCGVFASLVLLFALGHQLLGFRSVRVAGSAFVRS